MVVVALLDELDMSTASAAQSQVQRGLAEQPERLNVDLSNVTFIGSAGLGVLLYAHEEAERVGAQLNLTGVQGNRIVRRCGCPKRCSRC
jgi:anti-sigma B factor antagonist